MGGNIMQRTFAAVAEAGMAGASRPELEVRLPYEPESIRQALVRLRDAERVGVAAVDRRTRYFVVPGTRPPQDRRGRWPRARAEAA